MNVPMVYSKFGYTFGQSIKNSLGVPQKHSGIDLNFGNGSDDCGKPITAMAAGKVIYSAWASGWGNLVVIEHALPFEIEIGGKKTNMVWSRYGHLQKANVKLNDIVKEGDSVGLCGHTGGNWACHLHFDVIIKHMDPVGGWASYTSRWTLEKLITYYTDPLKFIERFNEELKKKDNKEMIKQEQEINALWENFKRTGLVKKDALKETPMTLGMFADIYFKMKQK
jgi:murein DD-endopeptidase MepM/ murein hydrolase activator NlpD